MHISNYDIYALKRYVVHFKETLIAILILFQMHGYGQQTETFPRILVILVGNIRGSEIAHKSLECHVLKPYQADLFLCTEVSDQSAYLYQLATYLEEYVPPDNWHRVLDQVSMDLFGKIRWRKYKPGKLGHCLMGVYDQSGKWTGVGSGLLTLCLRYHALKWLEKAGVLDNYDYFIVSRTDFYYLADHPSISDLLSDGTHIAIPYASADSGGICDRHAVLDKTGLLAYLNSLVFFLEYHPEYCPYDNIEKVLSASLCKQHHFKIKRYLTPSYTVRCDSDGMITWGVGSRRDVNGLWIKQENEYEEAQAYLRLHP